MIPDVNVLVGALQPDDPHHADLARWLGAALNGVEPVGFSLTILSGAVRVLTNQRIFRKPPSAVDVIARPGPGTFAFLQVFIAQVPGRETVPNNAEPA